MQLRRFSFVLTLAVVALSTCSFLGCSSGNATTQSPTPTPNATPTPTPTTHAPSGTWSRIGPSGYLNQLVVDPNNANQLFGWGYGTIFKSFDQGTTWQPLVPFTEPGPGTTLDLAMGASSTLYFFCLTDVWKLCSTADDGATINSIAPSTVIPNGNFLAIDPQNEQVMYRFGGSGTGLGKTIDGGQHWTSLSGAPQNTSILAIDPANPQILYAGETPSSVPSGITVSQDGGTTWTPSNTGIDPQFLTVNDIQISPTTSTVWAAVIGPGIPGVTDHEGRIYQSVNHGTSWNLVTQPATGWPSASIGNIQISKVAANTIYAGFSQSNPLPAVSPVFKSTNAGATWNPASTGLSSVPSVPLLVAAPSDVLFTNSGLSLFKSADGGNSWSQSNNGIVDLPGSEVRIIPGNNPAIYFLGESAGFWQSNDLGGTWTQITGFTEAFYFTIEPGNANHILVVAGSTASETMDGGANWNAFSLPANVNALDFSPSTPGLLLGCGTGGVIRSVDNGATWTLTGGPTDCNKIAFDTINPSIAFAAAVSGIYRSSDQGTSWTLKRGTTGCQTQGCTNYGYTAIAVDPVDSNVIYVADVQDSTGIKSTDGGQTWTNMRLFGLLVIDPLSHNTLYALDYAPAVVGSQNVLTSTDAGLTWAPVQNGLGIAAIFDLAVFPGKTQLLGASGQGTLLFQ